MAEGRRIEVRGTVQGVGFRPWVFRLARQLGIEGRVRNDARGVIIDAFASEARLDELVRELRASPPPAARVRSVAWRSIEPEATGGFTIVASEPGAERRVCIPPDLPTCADCLRELFDPRDRRFRYPFINCTNCGPRFTIAIDVPYDRPATTMASFALCADCAREYRDPADRRFHAQPVACPRCGPTLRAVDQRGAPLAGDPIAVAAEALRAGRIAAIKGLGGFHLACDATSPAAVQTLRERKRREERPFAVMVADLAMAEELAELSPDERALLTSLERPIALVRRRAQSVLCREIAPDNPLVGLLLPYTPLHHLLLAAAGRPLVMTSGNASEEPIAYRDDEALARLRGIADLFLLHDRAIETRCDDSIARVIGGAPTVLRRSRGFVPRPIALAERVQSPVLAVGGHLKNTFCIAAGDQAVLGPHVGDLDSLATFESLGQSIARMQRFLRVEPRVVAHDLHPLYASTLYALERSEPVRVGVQHHHAHVASAMAEHGLRGPVLGVAWDGSGWGPDGTSWGGELLLATYARFDRIATLRPMKLAGGERALREVWRIALLLLDDACGRSLDLEAIPLFRQVPAEKIALVRELADRGAGTPLARGVGRLFDGIGALALGRARSSYEGQVALEWNVAAAGPTAERYGFALDTARDPWELDLRPMVREIAADLLAGRPPAPISAAFHQTLARAAASMVVKALELHGRLPVVLTGGCFQNALLTEAVLRELSGRAEVFVHREVPPGDGGLALGQALVANAIAAQKGS